MHTETYFTDDQLVMAALGGDERSAAQLYHRYADRVYRISYRVVLNESHAKDTAQETWMKVFQHLDRYRLGSSFGSWVSSIAVRTGIDGLRKHARIADTHSVDDLFPHPASNDPCARSQLAEQEIEKEVMRAMESLSAHQRVAFFMRHFEDASLAEIAEILGCPQGTVKVHIHRAMTAIRIRLNPAVIMDHFSQGSENS